MYRGLNAPPRDPGSKYLEEFEPEHSEENVSVLNKALGSGEKPDKSGEISVDPVTVRLMIVPDDDLLSNLKLPSHEEVENDSLNNLLEFEKDLQPPSGLAVEHK